MKNKQYYRTIDWFSLSGDKTLRLRHDLNSESVVFDIGGYKGETTEEFFLAYECNIYVFEPVIQYCEVIKEKFKGNDKIKVFPFGLAGITTKSKMLLDENSSSLNKHGDNDVEVQLVDIKEFLDNHSEIEKIDLADINIEGGEYDLLKRLIETDYLKRFDNLQVQFHDFVPNAEEMVREIRDSLLNDYYPTYMFDFVWENWRKIDLETGNNKEKLTESFRRIVELNSYITNERVNGLIDLDREREALVSVSQELSDVKSSLIEKESLIETYSASLNELQSYLPVKLYNKFHRILKSKHEKP